MLYDPYPGIYYINPKNVGAGAALGFKNVGGAFGSIAAGVAALGSIPVGAYEDAYKKVKADIAKRNFESGLKQYSGKSDYIFKSHTFEVPTLYFCEKCDPPLK